MMTTRKVTKILIDKVLKVEVERLEAEPMVHDFEFKQRAILISTEGGEQYELTLQAASAKSLEFQDLTDWVEPLVYKGKEEE